MRLSKKAKVKIPRKKKKLLKSTKVGREIYESLLNIDRIGTSRYVHVEPTDEVNKEINRIFQTPPTP